MLVLTVSQHFLTLRKVTSLIFILKLDLLSKKEPLKLTSMSSSYQREVQPRTTLTITNIITFFYGNVQLHPDRENRFPFKRGRAALNSRLDVEMGVLNTERGGETERPTRMDWSPHESHTKLPNFPKRNLFVAPHTHTDSINWKVSLVKVSKHTFRHHSNKLLTELYISGCRVNTFIYLKQMLCDISFIYRR